MQAKKIMYKDLLSKYPIITDQIEKDELAVILELLEKCCNNKIDGDVVEFGCYEGTTSLFLQRLLIEQKSDKKLHVYDSFDGLPEKSKIDESPLGADFKRGELRATKNRFIHNFRSANLPLPVITKKWFHEIEENEVPHKISFAFLDGDYYKSIRSSLDLVRPRMQSGGYIIVDDYDNPKLPGASRAVTDSGLTPKIVRHSLAVIYC